MAFSQSRHAEANDPSTPTLNLLNIWHRLEKKESTFSRPTSSVLRQQTHMHIPDGSDSPHLLG